MVRRRSTQRRRTRSKGVGASNDGASFKSQGQGDFTSPSGGEGGQLNGNAKGEKENHEPQGKSPLHRPSHLANGTSGRSSSCSDEGLTLSSSSSCGHYTSTSTPSCTTPSQGSYSLDSSRTGTPSMQTPSIKTPSMRTPSIFSQSYDSSSFDSSLDYESYDSSACGTPVTPRSRPPHLAEASSNSSSLEETIEEKRAKRKSAKNKRHRNNLKLRKLAALHMENVGMEKGLAKGTAEKENVPFIIEVHENGGITLNATSHADSNGNMEPCHQSAPENSGTGVATVMKERENSEEVVDEGFSENFDKAQRKDLEETIIISNKMMGETSEGNIRDQSVNIISVEVEGKDIISKGEDLLDLPVINKGADDLLGMQKVETITLEVSETQLLNEKNIEGRIDLCTIDSMTKGAVQPQTEAESGAEGDVDDDKESNDKPTKEETEESVASPSEPTSEEETVQSLNVDHMQVGGSSPTSASANDTKINGTETKINEEEVSKLADGKENETSDNQETQKSSDENKEEIETIECTKAQANEITSALINDNIQLINPNDKITLVDVIETEGCPDNLVVVEMNNRENNSCNDTKGDMVNSDDTTGQKLTFVEVSDTPAIIETGYEEIFPEEHTELVEVVKGETEGDEDIVIFEVKDPEEMPEDDEGEVVDEEEESVSEGEGDKEVKDKNEGNVETKENEAILTKGESGETVETKTQKVEGQATDVETSMKLEADDTNTTLEGDVAKKPAGKVDAALAELDSIPDGVCESGEVEEEEEDEEEWSYFRMEPQTQPQSEDVLGVPAIPQPTEEAKVPSDNIDMVHDQDIVPIAKEEPRETSTEQETDISVDLLESRQDNDVLEHFELKKDTQASMEVEEAPLIAEKATDNLQNMDMIPSLDDHPERLINFSGPGIEKSDMDIMEGNSPHGSGSPKAPGSPRSVEGFVTSVELNTPDESFATNFAINQAQDAFAAVDQTSGPFSVYVSSSPEPASLDPPVQSSVDLLNMSSGMTNGQIDEDHVTRTKTPDLLNEESPVEIVHAQSTVEVVAPPSPVDVSGPDTHFIVPEKDTQSEQVAPVDISFVPEPTIEPTAEIPVPVYVDDTPVSENDVSESAIENVVNASQKENESVREEVSEIIESKSEMLTHVESSEAVSLMESTAMSRVESAMETSIHIESSAEAAAFLGSTSESMAQMESTTETMAQMESTTETMAQMESTTETMAQMESTTETMAQMESTTETMAQMESTTETMAQMESTTETMAQMESTAETISHMESTAETMACMESTTENHSHIESSTEAIAKEALAQGEMQSEIISSSVPELTTNEASQGSPVSSPIQPSPVPIDAESSPIQPSPVTTDADTIPTISPTLASDVTVSPVDNKEVKIPATKAKANIPQEKVSKASKPSKPAETKSTPKTRTPSKPATADKTPAKPTPGKATPSRSTPSRTTPGRTPTTRTPSAAAPATKAPTTRTPVTKSTEKKTPTTKPSTPVPTSRSSATRTATSKPATTKPAPTTKPVPARTTTKPTTTRAPVPSTTRPAPAKSTGTTAPKTGASTRPVASRPTPTARTTTATRKPLDKTADKTDSSKLANGGVSRPTSRPGAAKPTSSTTTARRPLASAKTAAEKDKDTKNTTNRILSTNPSKPASATSRATTTKTSLTHSRSKVTESATAAKGKVTSTTRTTASKTTGAVAKKSLVSKTKTQAGAKETSIKTKTEAKVIEKTEPLVNGENKIADEETCVEVIEKCAMEDIMQASSEKVITETMTSEVVVATETTEVLVNGDH